MNNPNKIDENRLEWPINTTFEEIFYQSPIGIFFYDKDGRLTNANDSALKIARIPKLEDVLGTNLFDNPKIASNKAEILDKGLIKFQDTLDLIEIKEHNIYNPIELKIIDIDWTVSVTDSGYIIQIQDITNQKFVEDSLKESESILRSFFDSTGDMRGIIEVISDNDIRHIADNVITARYLGITPDMMRNKLSSELGEPKEIIHRWIKHYKESERTGKPVSFEYLDERENKEAWLVATVNYIGTNSQGQSRYGYVVRNINEYKKAEEALRISEDKFSKAFKNSPNAITITRISDGKIIEGNESAYELFGYTPNEVIGNTTDQLNIWANQEDRQKLVRVLLSNGFVQNEEFVLQKKDKSRMYVNLSASLITIDNQKCFLTSFINITNRKKAEEALRESEERLSAVLDNTRDVIVRFNLKTGVYEFVSPSVVDLVGYSPDEFINMDAKTALEMIHPDDVTVLQEATERTSELGYAEAEYRQRHKNGEYIWVSNNMSIQKDNSGKSIYRISSIRDITNRKKSVSELKHLNERLSIASQSAKIGIWDWNIKTDNIEWNPMMFEILGLDPKENTASFDVWNNILHSEDLEIANKRIEKAIKEHKFLDSEYRIQKPNGQIRWINALGQADYNEEGIPRWMTGVCIDITERKKAEDETKKSLEEKELLLREIHHRVKNNLQIIASLLNLQESCVKGEELNILKESELRVKSMAIIHEKVYQSTNLTDVNFKEYIEKLVYDILYTYGIPKGEIQINLNIEDINLNIDTAIPLGLIINELINNSVKYAFPEDKGTITINMKPNNEETELIITDDGIGLPKDINLENSTTLGLQLVNNLTNQIDGHIEIDRSHGTKFKITFKEIIYKQRT
jgi:PAS domain S-box-containing protein